MKGPLQMSTYNSRLERTDRGLRARPAADPQGS